MKIYFLLLALLLINLSYSQRVIRGSGGNNGGGLGSAQSSSGGEESETIGTSIDIEGDNPFESGGDEEEPPVEEEVPVEEEPPFEEEIPEEEVPVEEEIPEEEPAEEVPEEEPVEEVPEEEPIEEQPSEEEETPAGAWEAWDMEEAQNSPEFMGVWDWCLGYTLEQAYQATLISGNYGNQKLVGVWRQPVNGWNYKIDCEVYDDQNNVVKMSIVGYYQQAKNSRAMRNFTYGYKYYDENNWENDVSVYWNEDRGYWIDVKPVLYPEEAKHYDLDQDDYLALGGYQPMPVDEIYKDQDLYNYLVYGAQYITKYGKEQEYLNQEYPYNVKEVYSIYGQWNEDKSVKWYRCEVGLDNGYGGQAVSSYEVHWEKDFEAPEIPTLGFKRIQNQ